jgi:BirA family biotin operon repressor/biotin-[acetyl-CoA-carboxylase] ligase
VDGIRDATGLEVGIKWPNDIVTWPAAADAQQAPIRKLAGLLTESAFTGEHMDYAVVGMGVNVNLDVADLPVTITPATSLSSELGRRVERLPLLWAILRRVEDRYLAMAPSATAVNIGIGKQAILVDWSARLVTLGKQVRVSTGEETLEGAAESVDAEGALHVRTEEGMLRRITVGDVSLRGRRAFVS